MGGSLISRISSVIELKITTTSNPGTIDYSSNTNTLLINLLHLINDQRIMVALLEELTRQIIYPICDLRLTILTNKTSIKIIHLKVLVSS